MPDLCGQTLFRSPAFSVHDVRCRAARGGWAAPEQADGYTLAVRRFTGATPSDHRRTRADEAMAAFIDPQLDQSV